MFSLSHVSECVILGEGPVWPETERLFRGQEHIICKETNLPLLRETLEGLRAAHHPGLPYHLSLSGNMITHAYTPLMSAQPN